MDVSRTVMVDDDAVCFADHMYGLHGTQAGEKARLLLNMAVRNADHEAIARWSRIIEALDRLPGAR